MCSCVLSSAAYGVINDDNDSKMNCAEILGGRGMKNSDVYLVL